MKQKYLSEEILLPLPYCKDMNWTLGGPPLLFLAFKYKLALKTLHHQALAPNGFMYDYNWFNYSRKTLLPIFLKRQASEICQ